MSELTELEGCTLAVIWRRQPCSAYRVQQEFAKSITPEWSGSTGAIYPAIARLVRRGLVEPRVEGWGKSGKKILRVSRLGEAAVTAWVSQIGQIAATMSPDPVRTRMFFLDAVAQGEQRDLIVQSILSAEAGLELARDFQHQLGASEQVQRRATEGAIAAMEARVAWLRTICAAMDEAGEPGRGEA